ncbi:RagB/SusD family nutrient uptake outer membrane protein [Mucilaginibacter sp. PAMB04274]|uniref:RagB/SusD family nutrient uptake outer membrane protein n=1 Tax=Mucilaginibacter sp. PAMB04274 TaxID=3138568 RepID=UPI0031F60204
MKLYYKVFIVLIAASILGQFSCKKLLEQNPRASITPSYFTTQAGVQGGITGVYQNFRSLWGSENFFYTLQGGTDEVITAGSASTTGANIMNYTNFVNNADVYNTFAQLFQNAYQDINTLNGVLQFGQTAFTDAAVQKQYLAQAKFLRAFLYFELVRTFGDVPLHTTYINESTLSDSRAPIADVYNLIIQDLTQASTDLQTKAGDPITSTVSSAFAGHAATKASALFLLSKVYLTRGWSSAAQPTDFQNALTTSQNLINNAGTYNKGLYASYDQAYTEANDASNREDLFSVEHNTDPKYGEYSLNAATPVNYNGLAFYFRPNYPSIVVNYPTNSGATLVTRDLTNGRPFQRVRPNPDWVESVLFADKTNDFRYWNTFQTAWIANNASVTPRGTLTIGVDTAIWVPPYDPGATKRAAFKGVIFLRPSVAAAATGVNKNAWTTIMYPSVKKFDNPGRPAVNDASIRPIVLLRFSELYLIAAEAAFKLGDYTTEANMLNVLRTRAVARPITAAPAPAGAAAALQVTAGQLQSAGIDFILDERSRELFGESLRWYDLVRTQSLVRRVKALNPTAGANIQDFMVLRPIPQRQIDLVTVGPKFPQNPGY